MTPTNSWKNQANNSTKTTFNKSSNCVNQRIGPWSSVTQPNLSLSISMPTGVVHAKSWLPSSNKESNRQKAKLSSSKLTLTSADNWHINSRSPQFQQSTQYSEDKQSIPSKDSQNSRKLTNFLTHSTKSSPFLISRTKLTNTWLKAKNICLKESSNRPKSPSSRWVKKALMISLSLSKKSFWPNATFLKWKSQSSRIK